MQWTVSVSYIGAALVCARDNARAASWYRRAADAGSARGMSNLGYAYSQGLGVNRDEKVGIEWLRRGVDGGDETAMTRLGMMYEKGICGLPRDGIRALEYYLDAAILNEDVAMEKIGSFCEDGRYGTQKTCQKQCSGITKRPALEMSGPPNGWRNWVCLQRARSSVQGSEARTWMMRLRHQGQAVVVTLALPWPQFAYYTLNDCVKLSFTYESTNDLPQLRNPKNRRSRTDERITHPGE